MTAVALPSERGRRFSRVPLSAIKPSPARHLIKPFVPRQGVCVIAGPSTTLKTFLAIEMGLRVSRGEPFHGHRVQQAGVVYVSAEDAEGVRLRIAAWCLRNGRHGAFELIPEAPDLRDGESVAELIAILKEASADMDADGTRLGLVVLDTLSKSAAGADQNSSADMGLVMSTLARISAETGATVLVVAHSGKDEARGIAGWYGQYAAADLVIMTARDAEDAELRIASLSKVKNGPDGKRLAFRLEVVELGHDEDGDPITSCVLAFEDIDQRPRKAKPTARLTGPETIALRAVRHLMDSGATTIAPPVAGVPTGTRAVKLGEVRAHAFQSGFSTDGEKADASKKRWGRAIEGLIAKEQIRRDGDLLWLV